MPRDGNCRRNRIAYVNLSQFYDLQSRRTRCTLQCFLLNYESRGPNTVRREPYHCCVRDASGIQRRNDGTRNTFSKETRCLSVAGIMKREAETGAMTGSGGPTSPHKRYRQGDDELRLLIPSKVSVPSISKRNVIVERFHAFHANERSFVRPRALLR